MKFWDVKFHYGSFQSRKLKGKKTQKIFSAENFYKNFKARNRKKKRKERRRRRKKIQFKKCENIQTRKFYSFSRAFGSVR